MTHDIPRLPDAELDIMLVLWSTDHMMKASEILEALEGEHSWKKGTLHVLLERLLERGFIEAKRESNYKLFSPKITEEEYRTSESRTFMKKLCRGSWKTMVASFTSGNKLTEEDIREIENILKNAK